MGKQPNSAVEHTKGKTHRVHIPTKRFLYSRHYHPMHNCRYIQNVSIRYNSAFQVNGDRSFDEILLCFFVHVRANHRLRYLHIQLLYNWHPLLSYKTLIPEMASQQIGKKVGFRLPTSVVINRNNITITGTRFYHLLIIFTPIVQTRT